MSTNLAEYQEEQAATLTARVGIIERACAKNFEHHSSLELHFNPEINVLSVANSSIMEAIRLCLGGETSSIERFIKEDCKYESSPNF